MRVTDEMAVSEPALRNALAGRRGLCDSLVGMQHFEDGVPLRASQPEVRSARPECRGETYAAAPRPTMPCSCGRPREGGGNGTPMAEAAWPYADARWTAAAVSRPSRRASESHASAANLALPSQESGGGGIRTLGRVAAVQRFSRPPRSTAPAPLREVDDDRAEWVCAPGRHGSRRAEGQMRHKCARPLSAGDFERSWTRPFARQILGERCQRKRSTRRRRRSLSKSSC